MFFDRLVNSGPVPVLEQTLRFTASRHKLLAENVANIDTPFYQQKDMDETAFQAQLSNRVEQRDSFGWANFGDVSMETQTPKRGILFHDGNNRSAEELMTNMAKNALTHNLCIELLRKQYATMEMALKERVS